MSGMAQPQPGPAPQATGPTREEIDTKLMQLYMQTGDQTILDYIKSGWTTPVTQTLQAQVQQIVGQHVNVVQPAGAPQPQPGPAPASAPVPSAPVGTPLPGKDTGQGGGTPVPDPFPMTPNQQGTGMAAPSSYGGGLFANSPGAPAYATSPIGQSMPAQDPGFDLPWGPRTTPAPDNPVGRIFNENKDTGQGGAGGRVAENAARAAATTTTPSSSGTKPGGGGTVSAVDPNSYVGQAGYAQAMRGDGDALDAVLGAILGRLGVDVTHPGYYTGAMTQEIAPYLQTYLRYFGLNDGKPAYDRAREAADTFQGMLAGPGTFGQIQDYGRSLVGGIGGLLNKEGMTPDRQEGMVSDLMGLLSAGQNQVLQSANRGAMLAGQLRSRMNALDSPNKNYSYATFLADPRNDPTGGLLATLLGAK